MWQWCGSIHKFLRWVLSLPTLWLPIVRRLLRRGDSEGAGNIFSQYWCWWEFVGRNKKALICFIWGEGEVLSNTLFILRPILNPPLPPSIRHPSCPLPANKKGPFPAWMPPLYTEIYTEHNNLIQKMFQSQTCFKFKFLVFQGSRLYFRMPFFLLPL